MPRRRYNPMSADHALGVAARVLKAEPWRLPAFLGQFGFHVNLRVTYQDHGDEIQVWNGHPGEWPDYVREEGSYMPEGESFPVIDDWDLTISRHLRGGSNAFDPLDPHRKSMEVLESGPPGDPVRPNPRRRPDALSTAARILADEPWRLPGFLKAARTGIEVTLTVNYYDGSHEQSWAGPPEDWREHVKYYADEDEVEYLVSQGMSLDAAVAQVLGWTIRSWDLVMGRFMASGNHWEGDLLPLDPYRGSMKALKELAP